MRLFPDLHYTASSIPEVSKIHKFSNAMYDNKVEEMQQLLSGLDAAVFLSSAGI